MLSIIRSPLLALLCLLLSVLTQAQNKIHCNVEIKTSAVNNSELGVIKQVIKGEFMFRKMEKWRVVEFTADDATLLMDYFLEQEETIACQAQTIDKTVTVFAVRPEEGEEPSFKKHITELKELGYFIINFHQSDDIVVFPMENCSAAVSIHHFEEEMAPYMECPPCGQIARKDVEESEKSDFLKVKDVGSFEEDSYKSVNESFPDTTEETEDNMNMKESFSDTIEETEESMNMKESFSDTIEETEESMNRKESFSDTTEETEGSMNMKESFSDTIEETEESMNRKESFSDTTEETEGSMNRKEPFSDTIEETKEIFKKNTIIENVVDTSSVQIEVQEVIINEEIKLSEEQLPFFKTEKPIKEKVKNKTTVTKKDQ